MSLKGWGAAALAASLTLAASAAGADALRIGLKDDPDRLDPDLGKSFTGRLVFTALCDKLVDLGPDLSIRPQLATAWNWSDDARQLTMTLRSGVTFHDGTSFDAAAVKYNIERSLTLEGSARKSELSVVESVDVVDPLTVRLNLKQPFAPLLATLTDRAGMMVSPTAAEAAGENFANAPVCSGPFAFVERVAQDKIVLDKYPDYWNADQIKLDRVVFLPIPDGTVRLANLRSGDLDVIERPAASDVAAMRKMDIVVAESDGLGYQGITINMGNGSRADGPLKDPRVREAMELAIDREVLNKVAFDGNYVPGNQPVAPSNPYYVKSIPIPKRDVERARQLLKEAGVEHPKVELMISNSAEEMRNGEILQAMLGEAGFEVSLNSTEFATALSRQTKGDFDSFRIGWSGRADPDGNIHALIHSKGGLNDGKYANAEVDALLDQARAVSDPEKRYALYEQAAKIYMADRQRIYLYHPKNFWGLSKKVSGFVPSPDAMIRFEGLSLSK